MANRIQFARGRLIVVKGILVFSLIVILLAVINNKVKEFNLDDALGDRGKRGWRGPAGITGVIPWAGPNVRNPCFVRESKLLCGPSVFLMGIQNAGVELLRQAIGLHPDVDCYSTGFFAKFDDLTAISPTDVLEYASFFEESSKKIQSGSGNNLCICESGRMLARTYDLGLKSGVVSPPEVTVSSIIQTLSSRTIVILRDPTTRFIQEYCSLNMYTPFEEVVDDAIAGFLDCEGNATRDNASCVYDASLSGLLQAGLYDFLINENLNRTLDSDFIAIIRSDHLVNPETRRSIMQGIFNYLDKDIPSSYDPYWAALNDLFVPKMGNCNGQAITDAAKQKLKDFYSTRATIFADLA